MCGVALSNSAHADATRLEWLVRCMRFESGGAAVFNSIALTPPGIGAVHNRGGTVELRRVELVDNVATVRPFAPGG